MEFLEKTLLSFKKIKFQSESPTPKELFRDNLKIAWPATLEGALLSIIGSIDTMMVGTLGSASIAAVGLTNQPRMILLILAQALCVGTTAIVARRKGAEDRDAANSCLSQSLWLITGLGIVMTLIGILAARPFMYLAGANDETIDLATEYFRIISAGMLLNFWQLCICAAMRAVGKTTITMITHVTANIVNVILNYCLIGGHFGFPALGVRGAAIATVSGTAVSCMIAFAFALKKGGYLRLKPSFPPKFDRLTISGLVRVGGGSIAESVCLRLGFLMINKMVANIGTAAFAAYQIVSQVTSLSFTLGDGISTAGATMVGQSLGAKRRDVAQANVSIARRLSVIASILLMAVTLIFRKKIGTLFTDEADVLEGVALAFIPVVVSIIPQNARVVYSGCLRGAGDVKYVAMVSLISVAIVRPLCTYVLCYPLRTVLPMLQLAVTGPWIAFVIDSFMRDLMYKKRIKDGEWLNIRL